MSKISNVAGILLFSVTVLCSRSALSNNSAWTVTSPDAKFTASVTAFSVIQGTQATKPGYIELHNAQGKLLYTLKHSLVEGIISSVAFSPDGKLIASAAKTGGWPFRVRNEDWPSVLGEVRWWDTQTGKLKHALIEPKAQMLVVTFSPDGKTLAAGGGDTKIRLLDVATGRVTTTLPTSPYIYSLDFSPDGRKLVAATGDKKVRVWNVKAGKIWKIFDAGKADEQSKRIFDAAFSPDGKTIASAGSDPLRWWDVKTGKLIKTFEETRRKTFQVEGEPTKLVFPTAK